MSDNDSNPKKQKIEVAEGKVLYNVVRDAFMAAEMIFYPNSNTIVSNNNNNTNQKTKNNNDYHFVINNDRAVLVWFDTIRDLDYFSIIKPWQVVNRLPQVNVICRKAPFVRIIQRVQPLFPQLYTFLPNSYILPIQKDKFIQAVAKHDRKHIIKPDNGSLGAGITILDKTMSYVPSPYLAIAQEYVESYLIDKTKFDLRIYCLVSSINPLNIFVYRGGVARFCSQPVDSNDSSLFSQLTNTAVNRTNPSLQKIDSITQMVNSVFEKMRTRDKVDVDALWKRIDRAITLTILAAYGYLFQGEEEVCKPCGYSRCFQILGFDVLLDQKLNPYLMEVNYRPSLETDTQDENSMKRDMLSTAMKIAAPLNEVQEFIRSKFITNTPNSGGSDPHNGSFSINDEEWKKKVNEEFLKHIDARRQNSINENQNKFVQTYPCLYDNELNKQYDEIIEKVKSLPTTYENKYRLPVEITCYKDYKIGSTTKVEKVNSSSHLPPIKQKQNQQNNINEKTQQTTQNQQKLPQKQAQPNKQTQSNNQTLQNKQTQPAKQTQQNKQTKPNNQLQQNRQTQQNNQTQQNKQTQPIKQTQQNKQTQPINQNQQNKQSQSSKQTQPNNQSQQNKQTKQSSQPQQNKQTQPIKQTQENSQTQQKKQNTKISSSNSTNNNNNYDNKDKNQFRIKEPSTISSTSSSKSARSKHESNNHSFRPTDKPYQVIRPHSIKPSPVSSSQTRTKPGVSSNNTNNKTLNSTTTIKPKSKDSNGTIKQFSTTNPRIGHYQYKDNMRASASHVKPNIRSSSNRRSNYVSTKI